MKNKISRNRIQEARYKTKNDLVWYLIPKSVLPLASCFIFLFSSCADPYFKNDYEDNSPTSGKLKVFYDEGLQLHIENQVYTFEAHYPNAKIYLTPSNDEEAVQALYNDTCKTIIISRNLNEKELKAFKSKDIVPQFSAIAKSGVAIITNISSTVKVINTQDVISLLSKSASLKDSLGNEIKLDVLFDKQNSSVMRYLLDTVLKGEKFASHCRVLGGSIESINYVAQNNNTIAFIDFAWLSDVDDSLSKANKNKIKFIAVGNNNEKEKTYEYPSQSSFKLNTYPYTRTVYLISRSGDFTLGKGFHTFVAGPNGQTSFLKQGLLPTKQQERSISVDMGQNK